MQKKLLFITLIMCSFIHCSSDTDPNRNIISFTDGVEKVENAFHELKPILDSLPPIPIELGVGRHYILDDSLLYIDAYQPVKINRLHIPDIADSSSKKFIRLILFLQKNHITAAAKFNNITWMYEYRKPKFYNESNDDYRDIIFNENKNDTLGLSESFKILDKKQRLLLVAFKDAIIR